MATTEQVLKEIRQLRPADMLEVRNQLNRLISELDPVLVEEPAQASEEEFEAALEEVTGCTAGSNSLERLLQERRRDLEQEQARLDEIKSTLLFSYSGDKVQRTNKAG